MLKKMRKGFTLIELMIVVAIIGILAAIAIPNFIKFQTRSKQTEAKANMKAIFTAQKAFLQEKDKYSSSMTDIGFAPERGNRYAYYLGGAGSCQDRTSTALDTSSDFDCIQVDKFKHSDMDSEPVGVWAAGEPGVKLDARPYEFRAGAAGNIDNDAAIDTWTIDSRSRTVGSSGVPSGEPFNDNDDVAREQ